MLTIACVWVGERYGREYPAILQDMVCRNLDPARTPRFVCITDRLDELPADMEALPPEPGLSGWWQKVALFKPGKLPAGRIAYFDLDVAVTGPLDCLVDRKGIIHDWHTITYNSSVMVWDAGEHAEAWGRFAPDVLDRLHGDQDWLTEVGGWAALPPEWCASYKSHARVWPPYEAKVVVFHGLPKPHEVTDGWVPQLWRRGGMTALPKTQGLNVSRDDLLENIRAACARDLTWFAGAPEHDRECCIVGGGPSLENSINDLRHRVAAGAALVSLNGTLRWLLERGLRPSSHVVLDGRPENAEFVRDVPPQTIVLVASQCHPDVFDALAEHPRDKLLLWHAGLHDDALVEIIRPYCSDDDPGVIVGGGSTVGLRAMFLAHLSGFRTLHLYGFDSCYMGEAHHLFDQALNDDEPRMDVLMAGKTYHGAVWMARQAQEFNGQHAVLTREGCRIEAHGFGLIPDICRIRNAQLCPVLGDLRQVGGVWWPASDRIGMVAVIAEPEKVKHILPHCAGRDVAVQAGANVGLVPIELAKHFARVLAFEPDLTNMAAARHNINGAPIELTWAALRDQPGTVRMCGSPENCGGYQTAPGGDVPAVTIDGLNLPRCDLIMLDVEGDEALALQGARATIETHRPVVVIEDKGLGARHGWLEGSAPSWLAETFGYRLAAVLGVDAVMVPNERM